MNSLPFLTLLKANRESITIMSKTFDEVMADVDKLMKIDDDRNAKISAKKAEIDKLDMEILELEEAKEDGNLSICTIRSLVSEIEELNKATKKVMSNALSADDTKGVLKDLLVTGIITDTIYGSIVDRLNLEESPDIEQGLDDPHDNIDVGAGYRETG